MKRNFLFRIVIVLLALAFPSQILPQSKGGCWQFENNGLDTGDWDNVDDAGSLTGGASFQDEPPLEEGVAYLFLDGTLSHNCFLVQDNPDLDFDNEDIAISAWIFPTLLNDVHFIITKGDNHENPMTTNYALRISKAMNLEFLIRDASNKAQTAASSFTIPLNQWTFVAVFYDYSAGQVTMWNAPDTSAIDAVDFNHPYFSNADPLCIGAWYSSDPAASTVKDFKGRIDDLRISGRLEDVVSTPTAVESRINPSVSAGGCDVQIYPNPVFLSSGGPGLEVWIGRDFHGETTACLYNVLGQEMLRARWDRNVSGLSYRIPLDRSLAQLKTGVYLLRVTNSDQSVVKKLHVIQ